MRKVTIIKTFSLMLIVIFVTSMFVGCNKNNNEQNGNTSVGKFNTEKFKDYPIDTDVTLTYWCTLNSALTGGVTNFGETEIAKKLEEETGVKIKYLHPTSGQVQEQFNIILASGDYPDIMETNWYGFSGGPENALQNDYIVNLNDVIEKSAPNLRKYLDENSEVDKMVKTDDGNYYVFPFIRGDDILMTFSGLVIRKDWLDDLGLESPTTIDELYTCLKAFKEEKKAEAALSFPLHNTLYNGAIVGAYGVPKAFFQEDGNVKFGPVEPGYKEFLITMAKWFEEGILDSNIANVESLDANILSGKTGVTFTYAGSGIGKWMSGMQERDSNFNLEAISYPVLNKGETPKFGQKDLAYSPNLSAAITTACQDVDLAARYLDFAYSETGHNIFNFGIENESYEMVDGYPTYTDIIMNNPDNLSIAQAMGLYIRANIGGPFVQAKEYIEQYYQLPQQKDAIEKWSNTDALKYSLPRITPNIEESGEIAKIMNDVNVLVDEWTIRFIMGIEPISRFDEYVSSVKNLNIDKAIEIYENAIVRYNNR